MICRLCEELIEGDVKTLTIKAEIFHLHKVCLRKATQKQLIEKGLVKPFDLAWWFKI